MKILYSLLLLSIVVNTYSQEDFFYENWEHRDFTDPQSTINYTDNISGESINISINVDDTITKVLPTIFGNNLPGWRSSLLDETAIIEHILRMNPKTMRIPGGNWSNTWLWDGINHWDGSNQNGYSGTLKDYDETLNYIGKIKSEPTTNWTLTTNEMIQICDNWNVEPQICVNYALARYIDAPDAVQQAAHYAAEWVRDLKNRGIKVRYWEIGNEHYGSWQAGYVVEGDTITGLKYGEDACVFIDSMKSADPDIKIGIVLYPAADYRTMPNYSVEVLQAAGDKADFLITHEYFTWASDPNDVEYSEILGEIPKIKFDYDTVQAMVKQYTNKDYIPVAMTEYNYTGGLKETEGIASLFFAHAIGEYIKNRYGLVNFWDIQNGNTAEDHGMFTLGEDGVEDNIPHPSFFPYFLYNKMFGDILINSTLYNNDISVYASKFSNGYVGVTVINESSTNKTLNISIPRYAIADSVFRYELSMDDLSSRKIYINGETSPVGDLYGPRNYQDIPPYLHVINSTSPITLGVKKYSVNYFVVRLKEFTTVHSNKKSADLSLSVFPNPSGGVVNISYNMPQESPVKLELYNNYGSLINTLLEENTYPGKHTGQYNLSDLPPGIYFIKLTSKLGINTGKLIIQH